MSDETSAPAGGDDTLVATAPAETPTELSAEDAGRALAELRWKRNNPDPAAESAKEATAEHESAQADAGTPGEEPEGNDPEAETLPPIERPRSWSKDADDDWNAIPRARQEKIAANEQARESDIRQRINDAAEKSKAVEAKLQETEKIRQQYEAKTKAALEVLEREQLRDFPDIKTMADVAKMALEDPFRKIQWDVHQDQIRVTAWEAQQVEQRKSQEHQTQWTDHVQKEDALAAEYIPELADKAKGPALRQRVATELLPELGFKQDELNDLAAGKSKLSIYDHRIQRLLADSLKLRDIQSARKAVAKPDLPPVQRPGTARPAGNANSERIQALQKTFEREPSVENATALRLARLKRA